MNDFPPPASGHTNRLLRAALATILSTVVFAWPLDAQQRSREDVSEQWEVLEDCTLSPGEPSDGDSFHVRYQEREYIFRLYFVDAPETDAKLKERVQDQAAYFSLSAGDIPAAGELAAGFTRQKLLAQPFTVITRWQNAMGRSRLARFYGMVFVKDENLAEALVENGLARIYGYRANWPGGPRSTTFINRLKSLEMTAREHDLGVWNEKRFVRIDEPNKDRSSANGDDAVSIQEADARLDLNSASNPELQKLPGIGRVLAERIIEHRPFKSFDELDKVPGIGEKTLAKLRPLVTVEMTEQ